MSLTADFFLPNTPNQGGIGNADNPWGEGRFNTLFVGGLAVAPLASPVFTGTPAAPTATAGTNTTQLATTAFVTTAIASAKARSAHTGTQLASTISDFATAVAALPSGTKAHDQGSDTVLDEGNANEVTAADLRSHLDNAAKHRQINDSGTAATDLWSAEKIIEAIAVVAATVPTDLTLDDISDAGALAGEDTVSTSLIADAAVTAAKVAGGEASPTSRKYWGTNASATMGFHDITSAIALRSVPADGNGQLSLESGELVVTLGTAANRAASGADTRFPTAGEKAALAGTGGTPGSSNKYVTEAGLASASQILANLSFTDAVELTIASNAVTATQSYHIITGTGPLQTINGAIDNQLLFLRLKEGDSALTIEHGAGNIECSRGADIVLSDSTVWVILLWDGTNWQAGYNSTGPGIDSVEADTAPTLGGNLDPNGHAIADGGGLELLKFSETASAVNEVTIANAATGNGPTVAATGDDTNIPLNLNSKGTGDVLINGDRALTEADEGSGNGLDADTVDGSHATAFALLAGRSGGQTQTGGTASGNSLTLQSTSHATKGGIQIADGDWIEFTEITAPGTPSSGKGRFYATTSGIFYKNSAGTVYQVNTTSAAHYDTIYIPASAMWPATTSGCSWPATIGTSNFRMLSFADAATQNAWGAFELPWDLDTSVSIQPRIHWMPFALGGSVNWSVAGRVFNDGDNSDQALGTAVPIVDSAGAAGRVYVSDSGGAITFAGTLTPGSPVQFRVQRDGATDSSTAAAYLIGVSFQIKRTHSAAAW